METISAMMQMGRRLRASRFAVGGDNLTQFAAKMGVEQNTWAQWESGKNRIDPIALGKFLDRYPALDANYILTGDYRRLTVEIYEEIKKAEQRIQEQQEAPVKRGRPKKVVPN